MWKTASKSGLCLYWLAGVSAHAHTLPVDPDVVFTELSGRSSQELVFLNVVINGRDTGGNFLFARRGPLFYGRPSDLEGWRVSPGNAPAITIDGQQFVALPAIPGIASEVDEPHQTLRLTIAGAAFRKVDRKALQERFEPTESTFSAFLNYDLSFEYQDRLEASSFIEAGVSDDWGLAANTMTVERRDGHMRATRLDTYFLRDDPGSLTRLIVGDGVTASSSWSRPVRFGGIRIGTEFGLQPGFITFPTPVLTGDNAIPSQIDVLVNNVLNYRADAEAGPFSITNLPLVTGAGEVTLRMRDTLGVERSVTTAYYASRNVLKPDLAEWSIEAGAARTHYGYRSFSYGSGFVAGSYRRSLANWLTAGGRAVLDEHVQLLGAEANMIVAPFGELGVATAVSTSGAGDGVRYRIFGQHIDQDWNAAISFERSSRAFRESGGDLYFREARQQIQAAAGFTLGDLGNLGASYTDVDYHDGDRVRIVSVNYNLGLGGLGYVNAFALGSRSRIGGRDFIAGLGLTIPFGARSSAYMQADDRGVSAEVRRTPPTDRGWGYRLAASTGDFERRQAELSWRGQAGEYRLQAVRYNGVNAGRLLASGGLVWVGGEARAGRKLGDAMAVVTVPGQADVGIYDENRLVAHTDGDGVAIVTGLRPYMRNKLSISASEIPLEYGFDDTSLTVIPRARGTAVAAFALRQAHPATVILHMPDGSPVPSGTTVAITGRADRLFAGIDGEVFIGDLEPGLSLVAETVSGDCIVKLPDAGDGILPSLGPFRCAFQEN